MPLRTRQVTPKPGPGSGPGSTPAAPGCRDQVEVVDFLGGAGRYIRLKTRNHCAALGAHDQGRESPCRHPNDQAIRFTAEVNIRPGNNITIQFIQNLVKYDGVLTNSSPPHNPLRFFKPGCDGTLLDMFQQDTPQPPAYLPYYRSTPSPSGTRLTIRAHDAPRLSGITVDHPDGTSTMQIDATYGYEMYLGCTIGDRKETFQTLGMLAWGVRFAGNLVYSPPWPVDPPERHLLSNNWAGAAYRFDLDESTAKKFGRPTVSAQSRFRR